MGCSYNVSFAPFSIFFTMQFAEIYLSHTMYRATQAAITNPQANYTHLKASLFHSTPVLDRKRRTQWDAKFNNYSRRSRKTHGKQSLLRNVSSYAEYLFQSWQPDFVEDDPSSTKGPSWFRKQYGAKGGRKDWTGNQGPQYRARRGAQFCEDDFDVETIFRSAFGGGNGFYWSFLNEKDPQWSSSSGYSNRYRTYSQQRARYEYEYDTHSDDDVAPKLTSDRLVLGLSASGPLKIDQVKTAYRKCALKWHPDRHQGSTKGAAEEKFKLCSAAYQSLCDKLSTQ